MNIDPKIFKTYDIRGVYPEQLNEQGAYAIGRAYATLIISENPDRPNLNIVVGSDMRLSSPALKSELIRGLRETGVSVDDIGLVSTPTFYFTVSYFRFDGGIQITASHNPGQWNGFKLERVGAVSIGKGTGMETVRDFALNDTFAPLSEVPGELRIRENVTDLTVTEQIKKIDLASLKSLKIVVDASNGMGAMDMATLFKKIPQVQIVPINFDLDGSFPAHGADPMLPENIKQLQERVVSEKADLGIAPDGDGDRYFFVDEKGDVVPQSIFRAIMARVQLEQDPQSVVAYDVRPSRIADDVVKEMGGRAIVTPVGHSIVKDQMIEHSASFGAEASGHYFYKTEWGTFEAPTILVTNFLKFLTAQNKPLSEVVAPYKKYSHTDINFPFENPEKLAEAIEAIKTKYSDGNQSFIDGVSVEYPDFWFNARGSNTGDPLLRLTIEAISEEVLNSKLEEIQEIIKQFAK
jgi:phosphomannomutase